jgi:thiol-disulfide isomerase/thioredoxin
VSEPLRRGPAIGVALAIGAALVFVLVRQAPRAAAGPAMNAAAEPAAVGAVEPAAVAVEPAAEPAVVAAAGPTAVGAPSGAPGYVLMDLAAIKRVVHGSGRPVLVHFWASWCGPCLAELPLVDKFAREMKAKGVEVISLSLDDPARAGDRMLKVLAQSAPNLTRNIVQVSDSDAFISTIDPQWEGAIPAMFGFDAQGTLRGRLIGEVSRRDLDGLVARVSKR